MADTPPLCAWLIGIRGLDEPAPGIGADLARLSRLVVAAGGQAHVLAGGLALDEARQYAGKTALSSSPWRARSAPLAGPAVVQLGRPELATATTSYGSPTSGMRLSAQRMRPPSGGRTSSSSVARKASGRRR
ncbi:MAG: hypothetical protein R3F43_05120 [bacterium]